MNIEEKVLELIKGARFVAIKDNMKENSWEELGISSIEYIKIIIGIEDLLDVELDDDFLVCEQGEKIATFVDRIEKIAAE